MEGYKGWAELNFEEDLDENRCIVFVRPGRQLYLSITENGEFETEVEDKTNIKTDTVPYTEIDQYIIDFIEEETGISFES